MLALKQPIGMLAMPLPLASLLVVGGVGCQTLRRCRRAAALYIAGGCVAYLASIGGIWRKAGAWAGALCYRVLSPCGAPNLRWIELAEAGPRQRRRLG